MSSYVGWIYGRDGPFQAVTSREYMGAAVKLALIRTLSPKCVLPAGEEPRWKVAPHAVRHHRLSASSVDS